MLPVGGDLIQDTAGPFHDRASVPLVLLFHVHLAVQGVQSDYAALATLREDAGQSSIRWSSQSPLLADDQAAVQLC